MKDLLAADHLELDLVLDELLAAFDERDAAAVYEKLDFFWARLAMHIRAEHLHLFPAILETTQSDEPNDFLRKAIIRLKDDHNFFMRELGDAIKQLRDMRENDWRDAGAKLDDLREKINVLRGRLEGHNRLEESDIYCRTENFTADKKADLRTKIQKELENLPPRFRKSV